MTTRFSKADWDRLPEGFPAQLVDGQLVKDPAPTYGHQGLSMRLTEILLPLVPRGLLVAAPSDVLVDDHNVYQPDLLVLREAPHPDDHYVGVPLLAIEILAPGTAARDRGIKARRLLELGVEEVWLVDPRDAVIELRTTSGAQIAAGAEELRSTCVGGFALAPERLFGD